MAFERKPHKYNEAIKAWADGKPIQYKPNKESCWIDYDPEYARQRGINRDFYSYNIPKFDEYEWRVKPENIVVKTNIGYEIDSFTGWGKLVQDTGVKPNIRFEFDPDTYKLVKAEMIGNE
jgi:hypothetical protein